MKLIIILFLLNASVSAVVCTNDTVDNISKTVMDNIESVQKVSKALTDAQLDELFEMLDDHNLDGIKKLLHAGLDPNTAIDGESLLFYIGLSNRAEDAEEDEIIFTAKLLKLIIKESTVTVDLNTKSATGRTPLHYAADGKNWRSLDILLSNNANPKILNNYDNVLISSFSMRVHPKEYVSLDKSLGVLRKHNIDINVRDSDGSTYPERVLNGSVELIEIFIKHKIDFNNPHPRYGKTYLFSTFPSQKGLASLKLIIEKGGGDYNYRNIITGRTLLGEARKELSRGNNSLYDVQEIVDYLVSIGAKE